jgi:glycosyltransferase involved in cell wall biosynthesis
MVPLYLPLTLDEEDQSAGCPIFFPGTNVFLEQKSAWFRQAPDWLRRLTASRPMLRMAASRAGNTRAEELGELTLSMLLGEGGKQARELDELLAWLRREPPGDVICLSNALLLGMARRIRTELRRPILCMLQGEDWFVESLPARHRAECWESLARCASEVDLFVAPSRYFAEKMSGKLRVSPDRVKVVHNGIDLRGYEQGRNWDARTGPPTIGFFARLSPEKGLEILVRAFILLRSSLGNHDLKLKIGGSCGPSEEPFLQRMKELLASAGLLDALEICPNLDHAAKVDFLRSLDVFSVPATEAYGEGFGLYLIEAMAAGVPAVQPRVAAFPEIIEATGGGLLCEPGDPAALAAAISQLLKEPSRTRALGERGRKSVLADYSASAMARRFLEATSSLNKVAAGSDS